MNTPESELIPHLFRTEFSKIVAVLCKTYGLSNIQLAEDLVSDAFLVATETWGVKGNPDHPKAWLYRVAKNKSKDYFKRQKIFQQKIVPTLNSENTSSTMDEVDLSDHNIQDSQLKMLFAVCHPTLNTESQIALALRVLCGFGIAEIAQALLTNKETINKRLQRAKKKLRSENINLVFPETKELNNRLDSVLSILYLLFNEGYFSTTADDTIQKDICVEAMRLLWLLLNNADTSLPRCHAMMALFCFHASRLDARTDERGEQILYADQNKDDWDADLIAKGEHYLHHSTTQDAPAKYHYEAIIAYWHTRKTDSKEKWESILQMYNRLLQIEYSPMTALNRTYALAQVYGNKKALEEAKKINLNTNHLYHMLLAELYIGVDINKQLEHLHLALRMARNKSDKKVIQRKINNIRK